MLTRGRVLFENSDVRIPAQNHSIRKPSGDANVQPGLGAARQERDTVEKRCVLLKESYPKSVVPGPRQDQYRKRVTFIAILVLLQCPKIGSLF